MAFALPNGSTVFVGSGLSNPVVVSTVSNAEGAVFTVTENHNLRVDDVVLISSGWGAIDGLVARITAQTPNSVTISVINSSDRNFFPAHAGGGKLQKITEWTEIPQITEVALSGGEQQYAQVQFLADDRQRNIGTFKAAKNQTFTLAHDASLPIYNVLSMADRYGQVLPLRMFVPNAKEYRYWSGVPSFDPQPMTAVNSVETVQVAFSIHSRDITFYKSEE
ncbi:phage tail protein [Klebsiella oxytoca]|uniref:Phage tail protein n=3 Tax=Klebsiella oxytoca TaxID=571 RepID=A0AAP2BGK1_KLEOX|nr:phage tail protein [Klebsiella oxytoca]RYA67596.1 phage tail protein [Enterobacter cloacae complex sp. 2DZ2F16B1]AVL82397.1 phage tail protein [Klebsiella oxytoca]EHT00418.1 hypothetical protein HMPREF9689_01811 [Klebsiella oxytoca 10-5245]EJA2380457.1 phage tail protein [Klebsiella oxytoca]EJA2385799.1 phage tail protein [Klebsiella oxytoca]